MMHAVFIERKACECLLPLTHSSGMMFMHRLGGMGALITKHTIRIAQTSGVHAGCVHVSHMTKLAAPQPSDNASPAATRNAYAAAVGLPYRHKLKECALLVTQAAHSAHGSPPTVRRPPPRASARPERVHGIPAASSPAGTPAPTPTNPGANAPAALAAGPCSSPEEFSVVIRLTRLSEGFQHLPEDPLVQEVDLQLWDSQDNSTLHVCALPL
jgi:hypothetical protein